LEGGRVPVAVVAARFGFASAAAYGFAFRQVLGVTPGVFAGRVG
jgi:transcriptional regulator GlxA family with amidase domain